MTNSSRRRCNLLLLITCYWSSAVCYQPHQWNLPKPKQILETTSRRHWILSIPMAAAIVTSSFLTIESSAAAAATPSLQDDPRVALHEAQETLATLLENWERATVDCTYADVPRELLEQKNKELLLEKAATNALFDKSVSVISCKTSNRVVRDYLGATGKGPLVGIDKKIRQSLDWMEDPDQLDEYLNASEKFAQAISRATSLSYAAGVADFDSVNNFEKGSNYRNDNSNLEQARQAIMEAKQSLDQILSTVSS